MFDKSQQVNVTYTKVFTMGRFSHWEVDINTPHSELAATAPDFEGLQNIVDDFLFHEKCEQVWYQDDATDYQIEAAFRGKK